MLPSLPLLVIGASITVFALQRKRGVDRVDTTAPPRPCAWGIAVPVAT
jgi:hypothetical protein